MYRGFPSPEVSSYTPSLGIGRGIVYVLLGLARADNFCLILIRIVLILFLNRLEFLVDI